MYFQKDSLISSYKFY